MSVRLLVETACEPVHGSQTLLSRGPEKQGNVCPSSTTVLVQSPKEDEEAALPGSRRAGISLEKDRWGRVMTGRLGGKEIKEPVDG